METLMRLRMSIKIHETAEEGNAAVETIDTLIDQLNALRRASLPQTG